MMGMTGYLLLRTLIDMNPLEISWKLLKSTSILKLFCPQCGALGNMMTGDGSIKCTKEDCGYQGPLNPDTGSSIFTTPEGENVDMSRIVIRDPRGREGDFDPNAVAEGSAPEMKAPLMASGLSCKECNGGNWDEQRQAYMHHEHSEQKRSADEAQNTIRECPNCGKKTDTKN